MSDPVHYIVLTEAADRHHVAVARTKPVTAWVQIIATFVRKERAEDYADIENSMLDEGSHGIDFRVEDHEQPPVADEPESGSGRVVEMIESSRQTTTRTMSYIAPTGKPRPASHLTNEILKELPILIEEYPKGPTAKIISSRLCVEEHFVRMALRELGKDGRAVYAKRIDSPARHLLPLGYDPPAEELSPNQRAVLAAMEQLADKNGIVRTPKRQIALQAECRIGSISETLYALERRGRLVGVDTKGPSGIPSIYRIVQPKDHPKPRVAEP